jgi:hydrogenase expression/formation protein HypC
MCLAIPGKVTAVEHGQVPLMGTVSFSGVEKRVCLDWVPAVRPGQYVIVHVGFGIAMVDEEEARKTIALAREMAEFAPGARGGTG